MNKAVFGGLLGLLLAAGVQAETLHYGLVSLSETGSRQVARDQMVLQLSIDEQGADRVAVANRVTQRINAVLQQASRQPAFNTVLESRNAYPRDETVNGRRLARSWQERASIRIESRDMAALNRFAAAVQQQAGIANIQYTVSEQALQQHQAELTDVALRRFHERAQAVSRSLGGRGYKLVQLNIGNSGGMQPMYRRMDYAAAAMAAAEPVMDTAPGETQLQLMVNGQIQVQGLE